MLMALGDLLLGVGVFFVSSLFGFQPFFPVMKEGLFTYSSSLPSLPPSLHPTNRHPAQLSSEFCDRGSLSQVKDEKKRLREKGEKKGRNERKQEKVEEKT